MREGRRESYIARGREGEREGREGGREEEGEREGGRWFSHCYWTDFVL